MKILHNVEDLLFLISYIDENEISPLLPVFVADHPDSMPTVHLVDGDMAMLLRKITLLEERCSTLQATIDKTLNVVVGVQGDVTMLRDNIAFPNLGYDGAAASHHFGGGGVQSHPFLSSQVNVTSAVNTESDRGASTAQSEAEMTEVVSRKKDKTRKRFRAGSSPFAQNFLNAARRGLDAQPPVPPSGGAQKPPPQTNRPSNKPIMVGRSTTAHMAAAQHLTLAKQVYRVSNVDSMHTEASMSDYVNSIGVRVMSCFDRTGERSREAGSKTFRVCILAIDKNNFLNDTNWFTGISIQKWIFKEKNIVQEGGGAP